jgi:DNA-binding NarL/FixJ family response regulator
VNFGARGNGRWPLAGHNGTVTSDVKPIRVVIVDDNPEFRLSATRLLEHQGLRIVGAAATSADAVRSVRELRPDVTLVDVELGAESGFDVAEALHDVDGEGQALVILISTYAEPDLTDMIEASPAVGFLAKSALSASAISAALGRDGESRLD